MNETIRSSLSGFLNLGEFFCSSRRITLFISANIAQYLADIVVHYFRSSLSRYVASGRTVLHVPKPNALPDQLLSHGAGKTWR